MDNLKQFEKLMKRVEKEDRGKEDKLVPFKNVRMFSDGFLFKKGSVVPMTLTDHAMTQVFTKLGIPVRYGKKLFEERPDLVAEQFNHWTNKEDGDVLLRMKKDNGNVLVRAVLSDRYSILDNKDVMTALYEVIKQIPEAEIVNPVINDRITNIRMVFPELTSEMGKTVTKEKDTIRVGVDIDNSEIGVSSLRVVPVTYRLVCSNGMRIWVKDGDLFEQRHIHLTSDELYLRMAGAISSAIKLGDTTVKNMRKARGIEVPNPLETIREIAKQEEYSAKLTDTLLDNFMIEPENNVYGLTNAFTRTARDIENTERRLQLEELAGSKLFELVAA